MESYFTPTNIMFGIGILSVAFNILQYIRKPQEKSEQNDAVFSVEFKNLEKTFTERFTQTDRDLANLRDNHLHTVEVKLDKHINDQQTSELTMAKTISRIETLLDERLPRI
jgi:hypothetical protein